MWFRFSRPDYFYIGRYRVVDASDSVPFNRGLSLGFGFFVLHCRWNEGRSQSEGIHYPEKPRFTVVINGQKLTVATEVLSYRGIVALAGERPGASVTYRERDGGRSGVLFTGEKVIVTDGMIINAVMTGNA